MGSLTSTPTIVKTTTPQKNTSRSVDTPPPAKEKEIEQETLTQEKESQERQKSLLARERGRKGTINTGLQGILASVDKEKSRKTLLGE
ncbi:MAG: hypothetical protein ACLFP8_06390 [Alphaproteobacteria bacterium]